jgi:hypothetical protein
MEKWPKARLVRMVFDKYKIYTMKELHSWPREKLIGLLKGS